MRLIFSETAWNEYTEWLQNDKKVVAKINALIKDIKRNSYEGIGKPEPLKYDFAGYWSRRITQEHRLIYRVENNELLIYACKFHYSV